MKDCHVLVSRKCLILWLLSVQWLCPLTTDMSIGNEAALEEVQMGH